ncbi:XRE family transcriptional regulator [Peptostreptococcus stomatis]|uniref:LexA family protein n=1 Tax=Peptostreptococcus stomatis TaxID=341694 RepID=UPI0028E4B6E2|nr:XRE family transcriptional regulator [Peptostreptococcus stomatis]
MNSNDEIIDILIQACFENDISQNELARRVGMAKSAISRYFNRTREFPLNRADQFAKALGLETEYLLGVSLPEETIEERPLPENLKPITKVNRIPIVGSIAAGKPILATENIESHLLLGQEYKADFALKIKGDSMIDVGINDGDLALIIKDRPISNGEIYAVLVDGEATLKKVYKNDDYLTLQPCNSKYEPIVVKEEDNPYIVGKLSGIVRKY